MQQTSGKSIQLLRNTGRKKLTDTSNTIRTNGLQKLLTGWQLLRKEIRLLFRRLLSGDLGKHYVSIGR